MTDQFFTPTTVAKRLVSFLRSEKESCVADFAAGDGELLRAAIEKWPNARCIATDVDQKCVSRLKRQHSGWEVGRCDFLNERSRNSSSLLQRALAETSLILLNPPFSCRGNGAVHAVFDEQPIRCSVAMAFILNSIPYIATGGRLVAILPASIRTSQKDALAWRCVEEHFCVREVASFGVRTFPNCAAKTVIVRLQKKSAATGNSTDSSSKTKIALGISTRIVRGAVPMHAARNGLAGPDFPLVHTTDLQGKSIRRTTHSINALRRHATGPAVLIPRVGKPDIRKCVLYLARKKLVLSDCVYAVCCDSSDDARELLAAIQATWSEVEDLYSGTCAPYLTVSDLYNVLIRMGAIVTDVEAVGFTRPV